MKTEWDYTDLAEAYLKRPDYAMDAIEEMLQLTGVQKGDRVCDVGAGAAHLTRVLAQKGYSVNAVEPNDAMRSNGIQRTSEFTNVVWSEGVGEDTGMDAGVFSLVTFGSSFNVCDRPLALKETKRILKVGGWFACMWNHRDLEDPLQMKIEQIFKDNIDNYSYGTRREDQTDIINESDLFGEVHYIEGTVRHRMLAEDFIEGWKSHGTVYRQSPDKFDLLNAKIRETVEELDNEYIEVPYKTRIWAAQAK